MKRAPAAVLVVASVVLMSACSGSIPSIRITVTGEAAEMEFIPNVSCEAKPAIYNAGDVDVFCFFEVKMPVVGKAAVEMDEAVSGSYVPLLAYETSDGWSLLEENITDGIRTSVYAYDELLKSGAETVPLFISWRISNFRIHNHVCGNYTAEKLSMMAGKIDICGYAVQVDSFKNLAPEQRWEVVR